MKTASSLTISLLVPLLGAGCYEVEDLTAVDDPDGSVDSTLIDAAFGEDGSSPERDGGSDVAPDARVATCASARDCADNEVCAPSGLCIQRCDDHEICIVATSERRVASLVAEGPSLYVGLPPTADRFGNLSPNAELRTLVGDGPWTLLASGTSSFPEHLEVHGNYVYWQTFAYPTSFARKLYRTHRAGGMAPEPIHPEIETSDPMVLSDTRFVARTDAGLYVAALDGTDTPRQIVDASDCEAPQATSNGCAPLALTDDRLVYRHTEGEDHRSVASSLDLGTLERRNLGPWGLYTTLGAIVEPYFYAATNDTLPYVFRLDLRARDVPEFTVYRPDVQRNFFFQGSMPVQLHGDWVYALATSPADVDSREAYRFERAAATGAVDVQPLLPKTFGPPGKFWMSEYTVSDTHVFIAVMVPNTTGDYGTLIYRIPLPVPR